jgi:hypothetical protein
MLDIWSIFRGGTFELRNRSTLALLAQVNNTGFGDALLFRISADLEHRVTEVVDTVPKTACAGWFRATGVSLFAELVGRSASVPMMQSWFRPCLDESKWASNYSSPLAATANRFCMASIALGQRLLKLAFEHRPEKFSNSTANSSFDRVIRPRVLPERE